jgi:hypothetical protein
MNQIWSSKRKNHKGRAWAFRDCDGGKIISGVIWVDFENLSAENFPIYWSVFGEMNCDGNLTIDNWNVFMGLDAILISEVMLFMVCEFFCFEAEVLSYIFQNRKLCLIMSYAM